ncbi:hypothetical protein GCM10012276_09010 [Nocardioides deserti]|nr:hypothetical protein GCM10012276_09010 [Nocardioides deserti]
MFWSTVGRARARSTRAAATSIQDVMATAPAASGRPTGRVDGAGSGTAAGARTPVSTVDMARSVGRGRAVPGAIGTIAAQP